MQCKIASFNTNSPGSLLLKSFLTITQLSHELAESVAVMAKIDQIESHDESVSPSQNLDIASENAPTLSLMSQLVQQSRNLELHHNASVYSSSMPTSAPLHTLSSSQAALNTRKLPQHLTHSNEWAPFNAGTYRDCFCSNII